MIITCFARKGGQTKTTSTVNIAACLVERGMRGTVCDLNHGQRDATDYAGAFKTVRFVDELPDEVPQDEFLIIDTAADFEGDIVQAVLRSDLVIIPTVPTPDGFESLLRVSENVGSALEDNPAIKVAVLLTCADKSKYSQAVFDCMRVQWRDEILKTEVPARREDAGSARAAAIPLVMHKPKSPISKAYRAATVEILSMLGK